MSTSGSDEGNGTSGENGTAGDVEAGARTAQEVGSTVQEAASGDAIGAAGAAAGAAGALGGVIGGEAGEAVRTGAQAVQTATHVAQAGQALATGNVGGAASSLGSAAGASRYLVPDRDAQEVLGGAGQAAQGLGGLLDGVSELASGLGGGSRVNVEYHLEVDGVDGRFGVRHVEFREQLSSVYDCVILARCDSVPEISDVLGRDVHLQMERGERARSLHGIVKHAEVTAGDVDSESIVRLEVVPALWLLGQNMRSRVFTDKTVPQVVEAVFRERLGGRSRTIRNELTRDYPVRELLVQYRETDLAFIQRRLEEEGIFYYFVHDGDHEELVLADANSGLPVALDQDDSRVAWGNPQTPPPGGECVSRAVKLEHVGATDVVVMEYNWTAPDAPPPRGERTGRGELDPPLEVYDHTDSVRLHEYDGTKYGANDAADQARMRAELLDLRRKRWNLSANLVGARPGHVIELVGCPDGSLDDRYVIVSVEGAGSANEGSSGDYGCHLRVVPASMPLRSARRTPPPLISGFESAVVAGPDGEEIHTDEHGRVHVRFHWDREHSATEPALTSCWMRVMHNWAGGGFGTTFIPRVGMEVVVAFFQGNPDQPFVLGCLYNGAHHSPVVTPDNKTQSAIRTKSSPQSEGFNELRFEDKAGSEFIFTHAQKDYKEVVEHDHSTHVKNCQTNTVDVNQTETVGKNQTMTVKKDRKKTVHGDETTVIGPDSGNRTETVHGDEKVNVKKTRTHVITDDETLTVEQGRRTVTVQTGKDEETYSGGRNTEVSQFDNLKVIDGANRNVEVSGQYNIAIDGHFKVVQGGTETIYLNGGDTYIEGSGRVQVKSDGAHLDMKPGGKVKLTASSFEVAVDGCQLKMEKGTIKLMGDSETQIAGASSSVKLEGSGATVSGPKITSSAQGIQEITGLLVKIN